MDRRDDELGQPFAAGRDVAAAVLHPDRHPCPRCDTGSKTSRRWCHSCCAKSPAGPTSNSPARRCANSASCRVTRVRSAQSACTDGASRPRKGFASIQLDATHTVRSAQADVAQDDADLASDLIASGVTTQSVDTVIAVLSAHRDGASINAAAKVSGSITGVRSGLWRRRPSVISEGSSRSVDDGCGIDSRKG